MDSNTGRPVDLTSYQECLYSWEADDIFASVLSPKHTQQLQEAFLDRFAPHRPPQERSIALLEQAIAIVDGILNESDCTAWSNSEEEARLPSGERVNLRQHRLLAFRQHLEWVYDVFADVPQANVTLR